MSRQPLWTKQQLEKSVHLLARDSARVVFTGHCLERMEQREVSTIEVLSCLRRGVIVRGPFYSTEHQSFEFRVRERAPRDTVCVVAAVKPVAVPGELFAITVWEI